MKEEKFWPAKPDPPKESAAISVNDLKGVINERNLPTGAKTVGGGTVKVFMSGSVNYYLSDSRTLRNLLAKYGIEP